MAYQPKYARKNDRVSPFFVLLGVIVVPVSLALTVLLLGQMVQSVGRPKAAEQAKPEDMAIMQQFDGFVSGRVDAARDALLSVQGPEPTVETTEPVKEKVVIEIPADAQVAPEPNPECYGQTDDPTTLQWLLDEAEYMLDGQKLYFSTDVELFAGSAVNYYLDDTIFAITWKEVHDGSVYTFSEVKINHPSQFRRHLAGGEYGSEMQFYTTEMAESVNAVVASSGDFYRFRNFGISVYQGQVRRVEGTYAETCYIDRNGDLHFTYGGDILTTAAAKEYVEENDIWFSLGFGPVLVDNYEVIDHTWYGVGEITEGYARAALCQMDELHYIVATANTEGPWQDIPTVKTFGKNIAATGCRMAYCLDGGQTAAIVMGDQLINRPVYGQQRKISDIIYFATAVPEGG
ncbi:MAG: phosphodiester glycosidase family protein [Faecousia sp.]